MRRYLTRALILGDDPADVENGEEPWIPDWYPLLVAAEHLHVPPWVLARQARYWEEWALIKRAAEASAEQQVARRDAKS